MTSRCHVDTGFAGDNVSQFSGVSSVLLGSFAVLHQKTVVDLSNGHENATGNIFLGAVCNVISFQIPLCVCGGVQNDF